MEKIGHWSGNIVNHFWFSCRTCNDDEQKLKVGILEFVAFICVIITGEMGWFAASCDQCA